MYRFSKNSPLAWVMIGSGEKSGVSTWYILMLYLTKAILMLFYVYLSKAHKIVDRALVVEQLQC